MEAAAGLLLLLLLGVSQGLETSCDGRQDEAVCYGPLGGAALIQLVDEATQIYRFELIKGNQIILKWVRPVTHLPGNRFAFTSSNGTFRINNLSRNDGGTYTLAFIDEVTGGTSDRTLHLHVQEPVSSARLSLSCLSQGERTASCVPEGGDSRCYSWTLDGRALTDAELFSGSSSASIQLKQLVSGRLACRIRNRVSSVSTAEQISTCGLETSCDGRQKGAECYRPLGGAALIQLVDGASQIPRFELVKDNKKILRWINTLVTDLTGTRFAFTPSSGTFRINNLNRNDSGTYTLTITDETTGVTSPQTLHLHVQEPVSSARLSLGCLSQGERMASCVPGGGDSLHYSWTLDGRALMDTELLSGSSSTASITLQQLVSGRLACRVWNHVSSVSTAEQISTCGFIFIHCTSNGTQISEWVPEEGNTLCVEAPVTSDPALDGDGFRHMNAWRLAVAGLVVVGLIFCVCWSVNWSVKCRRSGADGNLQMKPSD